MFAHSGCALGRGEQASPGGEGGGALSALLRVQTCRGWVLRALLACSQEAPESCSSVSLASWPSL